ncbi:hypothetical protein ACE25E_002636 [Vibrio cholerae]
MIRLKFSCHTALLMSVLLITSCAQRSESELRRDFNYYRPAALLTFNLPNETRVNNRLSIKESIDAQVKEKDNRKVIVVSRIGQGGADVAMERARRAALLLANNGENDPRMYVRKPHNERPLYREEGVVEIYVIPNSVWSDEAFVKMMKTDSVEIASLGGLLRSDVARITMNEAFERHIKLPSANVDTQVKNVLEQLGWGSLIQLPQKMGGGVELVISLPSSGRATPSEAIRIVQTILSQNKIVGAEIAIDRDRKLVHVSHGFDIETVNQEKPKHVK